MRGKLDKKGNHGTIVIRREEVVEGGGHGGAWKVAYADFVTAMMAFFLLMWLMNATTEDQRKGLADYFSPNNLMSHASSGTGQPFGGHTAFDEGALVSDRGSVQMAEGKRPVVEDDSEGQIEVRTEDSSGPRDGRAGSSDAPPVPSAAQVEAVPVPLAAGNARDGAGAVLAVQIAPALPAAPLTPAAITAAAGLGQAARVPTEAELRAEQERREKAAFEEAAQQIRDAVRNDPALAELARQLAIDMTPEGLRIQILDEVHQPMFATGSAAPNERARLLLQKVTPVLMRLPQAISIAGYTDAAPFPGPDRTNWELSTERANATRRLMVDGGLPELRIRSVTGHADHDPLLPAEPLAAANRRIAIVVLRTPLAGGGQPDAAPAASAGSGSGTQAAITAPAAPAPPAPGLLPALAGSASRTTNPAAAAAPPIPAAPAPGPPMPAAPTAGAAPAPAVPTPPSPTPPSPTPAASTPPAATSAPPVPAAGNPAAAAVPAAGLSPAGSAGRAVPVVLAPPATRMPASPLAPAPPGTQLAR